MAVPTTPQLRALQYMNPVAQDVRLDLMLKWKDTADGSTHVGTSSSPLSTSTADYKFNEWRCKSTATSGDNRLAYLRYDLDGAGGGGESLRALTDLGAANGTAHGAHISLQAGATGYITGLGVGVRGQLYIKNEALAANGTYYGMQAEIYSEGATSSVAAATKVAILNIAATGNATGIATVKNAIAFDGAAASADVLNMFSSVSLAELPAGTVGIRCLINGTAYRIPAVVETAWN